MHVPVRGTWEELGTSYVHHPLLIMAIELDLAAMGMGNGSGLPSNVRRRQTTIILPSLSPKKKDAHPFRHKQRISWFPLSLPTNIYYIFILALLSISMDGEREKKMMPLARIVIFGQGKELNSIHNVR